MAGAPLVELHGVSLRRPAALVLREITLRVDAGEAVTLLGANGSGKSTLLRVAATLLAPTGGTGAVLGAALGTTRVMEVRPSIGLIGHACALRRALTLGENLELVARLRGGGDARAALERVGLGAAADRRVEHCSNGMLRRADIARLFLCVPRLALLDETHVGLDPAAVPLVDDLVTEILERGGGAIVATHDPALRPRLAARAVTIEDGRVAPGGP